MSTRHLDKRTRRIIDELPDEAIDELLEYILDRKLKFTRSLLQKENLQRILKEDQDLLKKLAK